LHCAEGRRSGYSSGENYEHLEDRGLTGYIPPHGKYKEERPGFHYDAESDHYTCSQGNHLAFDKLLVDKQGNTKKRYLAPASKCKNCPIGGQCKGKKANEKRLYDTYYKAQYERVTKRLSSRLGKRMKRLRSATVEPVLGSLVNYFGLRQINTQSREAATKVTEYQQLVEQTFNKHKRRYGSRRIKAELQEKGHSLGRHQVRTLMKKVGLQAIQPKSFVPRTTDSTHGRGYCGAAL
jgi:hypothetical protein